MTETQANQLLTARAQYDSDAAAVAGMNATTTTYKPETWIRWTTIAGQFGATVADSIGATLANISQFRASAFINPGFDIGSQITRNEMDDLVKLYPDAAPIVAWCIAQAAVETPSIASAILGRPVTAADFAGATRQAQIDAIYSAWATYANEVLEPLRASGGEVPATVTLSR